MDGLTEAFGVVLAVSLLTGAEMDAAREALVLKTFDYRADEPRSPGRDYIAQPYYIYNCWSYWSCFNLTMHEEVTDSRAPTS